MNVRVERHELGPRLFVGGHRIHHHHWGEALVLIGLWFIWTDRPDVVAALHRPRHFDPAEIGLTTSNAEGGW